MTDNLSEFLVAIRNLGLCALIAFIAFYLGRTEKIDEEKKALLREEVQKEEKEGARRNEKDLKMVLEAMGKKKLSWLIESQ